MGSDWLSSDQRKLLDQLLDDEGLDRAEARITARPGERTHLPLSFAQQRMWFFHRLQPTSTMYNIVGVAKLRGQVDHGVLQRCVDELLRRHEVLRSTFHLGDGGDAVQRVAAPCRVPMPVHDLRGLDDERRDETVRRLHQQEVDRPFDLTRDLLLRPVLLQVADDEHLLLLSQHHIATDGWSLGILLQELSALYEAYAADREPTLPEPFVQYGDFALWQQEWQAGGALDGHLAYWRERLTGAHALELPTGRLRPPERTWDGGSIDVAMPAALVQRLKALGESERATLFMVLLAGVSAVLSRWSGQRDLVMGVPVANRNRAETESVVGSFVNTLPIRVEPADGLTFREFLRHVRKEATDGYAHQDVPFEKIIEEINPEREASAHTPLIRHMVGLHNTPWEELSIPGLTVDIETLDTGKARFDLEFELSPTEGGGIDGKLWFAADIMDTATVQRLLDAVYSLLEGAVANPDEALWHLPLCPERDAVVCGPEGSAPQEPHTVLDLIAAHRDRGAETPVVRAGEDRLTHGELTDEAHRLAHYLLAEHGVGPGAVVALRLPVSAGLPVALLGILAAGAVALPLDASLTRDEIADAVRRCTPAVVLTSTELISAGLLDSARDTGAVLCALDAENESIRSYPGTPPAVTPGPQDPALLIRSRGGTLNAHTHASTAARVRGLRGAFPLEQGEQVTVSGEVTADLLVTALLWPLGAGGRLCLGSAATPPTGADDGQGILLTDPVRLEALLTASRPSAPGAEPGTAVPRRVICAGGELWPDTADAFIRLAPHAQLFNVLSLAEAGPVAAHRVCQGDPAAVASGRLPVGAPLGDTRLSVLDEHARPVPAGVAGDLYMAGSSRAAGHLDRPRWTQDEPRPTGDRARWVTPGTLEILGRPAGRTVLQGRPVELGDVAAELAAHPAAARAHLSVTDAGVLVAHVLPEKTPAPDPERRRDRFAQAYLGRDPESDPALNTTGWRSPRSGEELTAEALREWTDAAVRQVLDAGPRRILEIGCRNGLLLFRLAPRCDAYRATEMSVRARGHIGAQRDRLASKADVVEVLDLAPDDFTAFEDAGFDTVVVNNLAAYCPDAGYLEEIVTNAVRVVSPGGRIVVSDVPDLGGQEAIFLPAELDRLPHDTPVAQLREAVARRAAAAEGFALAPEFFLDLAERLPGVTDAALVRRIGPHPGELTRFRYDAVLHVGPGDAVPPLVERRDWAAERLTAETFGDLLRSADAPDHLVIHRVPHSDLATTAAALEALHDGETTTAGSVAGALNRPVPADRDVDPVALLAVAHAAGYEAAAGPSGTRLDELTVALRAQSAEPGSAVPLSRLLSGGYTRAEPAAAAPAPDPAFGAWARSMPALLRGYLRDRLPLHAVPATVEPVTAWPLRTDGHLDVTAFPPPYEASEVRTKGREAVKNLTTTQQRVLKIWADVLGVDNPGIHDDFFALGGHSLMGAAVIDRLRNEFELDLPLGQLFQTPTVAEVSAYIDEQAQAPEPEETPAIRPRDRSAFRRKRPSGSGRTPTTGEGAARD
ncbi:condensation domain-containing protein [Streptomyces sp. NPDC014940]|uniref:condensation domain-containing protein n=1 Tax=Streptomyces sp. NPDC014940 TaxID=3364932 RepID=UPI0036FBDAC7